MFKLFLALLAFVPTVHAEDWSTSDTKREVVYQIIQDMDWIQTRNIAKTTLVWVKKPILLVRGEPMYVSYPANIHLYSEENNMLGAHPTLGAVNRYFLATSVLHMGISYMLPEEYRAPFQYVTIGIETGYVAHNYSIGLKLNL